MAAYAKRLSPPGYQNLLIALRSMGRYMNLHPSSRLVISIPAVSLFILTGSLMRDLDLLEGRRMAPIIAPRYSKELHVIYGRPQVA